MNSLHRIRLAIFVIGVAAMLAVLGPWSSPSSAATIQVSLRVNPGPAGSSGTLLCVWHGACLTPPTAGDGLDWRAAGGSSIYWRSWGFRSDTSSYATIGNVSVTQFNGNCKNVKAAFTDSNNQVTGDIHYTHTLIGRARLGSMCQETAATITFPRESQLRHRQKSTAPA